MPQGCRSGLATVSSSPQSSVFLLGTRRVDLARLEVTGPDGRWTLTALEAGLLRMLVERRGESVSRDEVLRAVWNAAPGVVTRADQHTVSRLRKKLEADPGTPRHLKTVYGRGYRLDEVTEIPAAPCRMPFPGPPPLGRESLIDQVVDQLTRQACIIVLTGIGGVGKTAAAKAIVQRAAVAFDGGVWWQPVPDAGLAHWMASVTRGMGLPTDDEALQRAVSARGRMLWVADEAERDADAMAALVARVHALGDRVSLLVTSRQRLVGAGLSHVAVPPLPLPGDDEAAGDNAAVRLLFRRMARDDPKLAEQCQKPDQGEAAARWVRRLGGHPLSIELLGAALARGGRTPIEGPASRSPLEWTDGGLRSERHGSLSQALSGVLGTHTAAELRAWLCLAAFESPFSTFEAQRAWAVLGLNVAPDLIGALARSDLVRSVEAGWLVPTPLRFLSESLPAVDDPDALLSARATAVGEALGDTALLVLGGLTPAGAADLVDRVDVLRATAVRSEACALAYAAAMALLGQRDAGAQILREMPDHAGLAVALLDAGRQRPGALPCLAEHADRPGLTGSIAQLAHVTLSTAQCDWTSQRTEADRLRTRTDCPPAVQAQLELLVGIGLVHQGEATQAQESFERLIGRARVTDGDAVWLARAHIEAGALAISQGRLEAALAHLEVGASLSKSTSNARYHAQAAGRIGLIHLMRGDPERARVRLNREYHQARLEGDGAWEARACTNLGIAAWSLAELAEAEAWLRKAARSLEATGRRRAAAVARVNLGGVLGEAGRNEAALDSLNRAITAGQTLGSRRIEASGLAHRGRIHLRRGDVDGARRDLNAAVAAGVIEAGGLQAVLVQCWLGMLAVAEKDLDAAERRAATARANASAAGPRSPLMREYRLLREAIDTIRA